METDKTSKDRTPKIIKKTKNLKSKPQNIERKNI